MSLRPLPRPPSALDPARRGPGLVPALLRGWWLILLMALFGGIGVYAAVGLLPRTWTAEALVAVDTQRVAIPELQGVLGGEGPGDPMPLVRSEVQALRSRGLLREAAEASGVASLPSIAEAASRVGLPDAIGERLSVFNDNRSLVISLAFTAPDPAAAARFVNALLDRYLASKAAARTAANRAGYDALSARSNEVRAEVEALEARLSDARARDDIVATRAGSVQQQQLEDLSAALARATAERAEAVATWERARSARSASELSDVVGSGTVARLRERESEASRRSAETINRYGPNHPDRRAAAAELAAAQGSTGGEIGRIVGSLRTRADAAIARERALTERLAQASTEAAGIATRQADLRRLEREVEARRTLLQTLTARLEQTGVEARAAPPSGMRVLSRAEAPVQPSGPKKGLAAGFGLLAGAALGALLALLFGLRRSRRAPADLEPASVQPWTPAPYVPASPIRPERPVAPPPPPMRQAAPPPRPTPVREPVTPRPVVDPVWLPTRPLSPAPGPIATAVRGTVIETRAPLPPGPPPASSSLPRFGTARRVRA